VPRACIVAVVLFLAALSPASASAASAITVSPTTYNFGNVFVGTQSTTPVTVSNTGNAAFDISGIVITGTGAADFGSTGCTPFPKTLGMGESCTLTVSYSPASRGLDSAVLTITSNAASGAGTVSLQGNGVAPVVSVSPPAGLAFGEQKVDTTSGAQTVTLTNAGDAALSIASIIRTGSSDFTITGGSCTPYPKNVPPSGSCTLTVTFTPSISGARTGALQLSTNDPSAPPDVPLSGTGTKPQIGVDPTSILFDDQLAGSVSGGRTLTVRNTGTAPMSLSVAELAGANPGEFAIAGGDCLPLPATVPVGASCSLTITFGPTGTGGRLATVHLVSDGGTADVPIGGTGTAPVAEAAGQPQTETPPAGDGPDEVVDITVKPSPSCVVPRLRGKTLAAAKRALKKAHCAIGKVTKRVSKKRPGRVISQSRRPGRKLRNGAKVGVVLARRA
jgi:hypothetical protein